MDQNKELKKAGLKITLPRLKILEILQEPVAKRHNIKLTHHSLYLYGECENECDED